jgi:hypothetical protein
MRICATCVCGALVGLVCAWVIGYVLLLHAPDLPEWVLG